MVRWCDAAQSSHAIRYRMVSSVQNVCVLAPTHPGAPHASAGELDGRVAGLGFRHQPPLAPTVAVEIGRGVQVTGLGTRGIADGSAGGEYDAALQQDVPRSGAQEQAVRTSVDLPAVACGVPVAERAGVQGERDVRGLSGVQQHLLEPGELLRRLGYR